MATATEIALDIIQSKQSIGIRIQNPQTEKYCEVIISSNSPYYALACECALANARVMEAINND